MGAAAVETDLAFGVAGERLDGDGFGFYAGRVGDGQAVLNQALQVERDGFADEPLDFGAGLGRDPETGQSGDVGAPTRRPAFLDDCPGNHY